MNEQRLLSDTEPGELVTVSGSFLPVLIISHVEMNAVSDYNAVLVALPSKAYRFYNRTVLSNVFGKKLCQNAL